MDGKNVSFNGELPIATFDDFVHPHFRPLKIPTLKRNRPSSESMHLARGSQVFALSHLGFQPRYARKNAWLWILHVNITRAINYSSPRKPEKVNNVGKAIVSHP